jgi:flagellar hook capping protein FlgD
MNRAKLVFAVTAIGATVVCPPAADAGTWFVPWGCETLQTAPPRVVMKLALKQLYDAGPLCEIRVAPVSYDSFARLSILDCSTSTRLTCRLDSSSGAAIIIPSGSACLDFWNSNDWFTMTVGGYNACFVETLYTTNGVFATGWTCVQCDSSTRQPVGVGDEPGPGSSNFLVLRSENPWRSGEVRIVFGLMRREAVELKVYDMAGRLVRTVEDRVFAGGGEHTVFWDGRDESGRRVARGVYFCRLRTPSFASNRKLAVLRD